MSESSGFGFGLGRIKDLQEAFSVASQVKENAMNLQNYLDTVIIEGKSSDGLVTVKINGNYEPLATVLDDSIKTKSKKEIESSVLEAMKNAYHSAVKNMKTEIEEFQKKTDLAITSKQTKNTTSQGKKKIPPTKKKNQ